ncbi:LOW QUALITY PROTEIN: Aspartic protease [Phytophthora megakarya]|uniref:Aspartic protease n=1 Tax=Phytophthora megakarya TaxID=4795 RepID=A0A225VQC9_9STRA|nr:LOW QUALITY PROTEIN: Aspartic protease [Phytophthora megakarya]
MVSLGLARRLKLKLKFGKQISVSGFGEVPTNITASAEVNITLGSRVVPSKIYYVGEYRTIRLPAFRKLVRPSTVWAGRGDRWVTQVLYAWKVPAAIMVVNISNCIVSIDWRTEVAQVVENGLFSRAGHNGRVSTRRYREWQTPFYENTISAKAQARESQRLDDLQKMEPPVVQTPNYSWPTKIMVRPSPGCEEARVVNLQIVPSGLYHGTSELGVVNEDVDEDYNNA